MTKNQRGQLHLPLESVKVDREAYPVNKDMAVVHPLKAYRFERHADKVLEHVLRSGYVKDTIRPK